MLPKRRSRWLVIAAIAVIAVPVYVTSQTQDPAALIAMRQAIGPTVDAVNAFSVGGSLMRSRLGFRKSFSLDMKVLLPDHYLSTHRDVDNSGFRPIDITYYRGFAGGTVIRRTDSNIPMPPDPGPNTAEAIAERDRIQMVRLRREVARFCLALLGRSTDGYPLTFSDGGTATLNGRPVDVVIATAADGYAMRLHIDAKTHLPTTISWDAPPEVTMTATMTSTVTTSGGRVVSQSPPVPSAPTAAPPPPQTTVVWTMEISDFKTDAGLQWPRRFKITADGKEQDEYRFGRYKINPNLAPKDFAIR